MCPPMQVVRAVLLLPLLAACGGPPPDPPSAVVLITPPSICEGDDHHTSILLDGRMSSAHLTLVPAPPDDGGAPLLFSWTLSGAAAVITTGRLTDDVLHVTSPGDRPLHVALSVTNSAGGVATTLRTVSITPFERERCNATDPSCASGVCAADLGTCIPDHACDEDADCEVCFACEVASSRCVPRTDLAMAAP
jgi:hypothetical protein